MRLAVAGRHLVYMCMHMLRAAWTLSRSTQRVYRRVMNASKDVDSSGTKPTLTFVTGNPRKLEEVQAIVGESFPWKLVSQDVDLPELQGEPEDIAREKCRQAAAVINGPVITEDTCLCFNALNGLPGPYIKWFLKKIGHEGLNNLLAAYDDKSGYAQCMFAYSSGGKQEILLFTGRTTGTIVPARGPPNFGWDPIFQPDGFDKTYAELDSSVKNTISHRYKALAALRDHFIDDEPAPPPEKKAKTNDD